MIHDSTPHRVFKISELTKLIASQLIPINQKSAVHLACSSRYLEEPVLSTLWETQPSLYTLLLVLPRQTWHTEDEDGGLSGRVRDPNLPSGKSNVEIYSFFFS